MSIAVWYTFVHYLHLTLCFLYHVFSELWNILQKGSAVSIYAWIYAGLILHSSPLRLPMLLQFRATHVELQSCSFHISLAFFLSHLKVMGSVSSLAFSWVCWTHCDSPSIFSECAKIEFGSQNGSSSLVTSAPRALVLSLWAVLLFCS